MCGFGEDESNAPGDVVGIPLDELIVIGLDGALLGLRLTLERLDQAEDGPLVGAIALQRVPEVAAHDSTDGRIREVGVARRGRGSLPARIGTLPKVRSALSTSTPMAAGRFGSAC